jgi:hypothetical protein
MVFSDVSLHVLNVHARDQSTPEAVHMVKRAFRNLGAVKGADHSANADDTLIRRKVRDLDAENRRADLSSL